jgi:hypothetical protein
MKNVKTTSIFYYARYVEHNYILHEKLYTIIYLKIIYVNYIATK